MMEMKRELKKLQVSTAAAHALLMHLLSQTRHPSCS